MAITTVRTSADVAAPRERVFAAVSDYRVAVHIIDDLEELTPVSSTAYGVGATFDAVMRVGPKTVEARIEITELVACERVTWSASGGDERRLTFELGESSGRTSVELTVAYKGPEGLSGILLAPVVEELVHSKARETLRRLEEL